MVDVCMSEMAAGMDIHVVFMLELGGLAGAEDHAYMQVEGFFALKLCSPL